MFVKDLPKYGFILDDADSCIVWNNMTWLWESY